MIFVACNVARTHIFEYKKLTVNACIFAYHLLTRIMCESVAFRTRFILWCSKLQRIVHPCIVTVFKPSWLGFFSHVRLPTLFW
jgi:hypothetical protein